MSERITRENALNTAYLNGKHVLFNVDTSHGIEPLTGRVHEGSVVGVCEKLRSTLVCFGFGHQSFTNEVSFDDIVAVADKTNGRNMEIDRFRGPYVDLRK
jgi:hypothetical protein